MGKVKIEFSRNAVKDYKKLPKDYKALIDAALLKLSEGMPVDVKPSPEKMMSTGSGSGSTGFYLR